MSKTVDVLESLAQSKAHRVDALELGAELLVQFGGAKVLAQEVIAAYRDEKDGGSKVQKNRMLLSIVAFIESVSPKKEEADPIRNMSTEDLAVAMRQFCSKELAALKSGLCESCCQLLSEMAAPPAIVEEFRIKLQQKLLAPSGEAA